jgi:hypothetical protein
LTRIHMFVEFVLTSRRLASLPCFVLSVWIGRESFVIVLIVHRESPSAMDPQSVVCGVSLELRLRCGCGLSRVYSSAMRMSEAPSALGFECVFLFDSTSGDKIVKILQSVATCSL